MTDKWEEAPGYFTDKHAACMTLRDHFAGLAMQALIGKYAVPMHELISERAYEVADAMLKEREKK